MKQSLISIAAIAALAIAVVLLGTTSAATVATVDHAPRAVVTATAGQPPAARTLRLAAVARASDRALVAFAQPGRVAERHVEVGATVAAGDPIATLDAAPLRSRARAAEATIADVEAQLDQLDRELERARRLVAAEIGPAQSIERLQAERQRLIAAREAASAQRDETRRLRRETTLEAPVAGVVTDVFAQPGEVVAAGTPIALIIGDGAVEVEVDVPESVFGHLDEGDVVTVDFPMSGRLNVRGTVSRVAGASAGRGRLFPVVVAIDPGADVAPGMAAEVAFNVPVQADATVPLGALVDPVGDGPRVLRVIDDSVDPVPVRVTTIVGDLALVRGPLAAGDSVVVRGARGLAAGDPVSAH